MKKSILMGLGVCALALGGVAALVGQKGFASLNAEFTDSSVRTLYLNAKKWNYDEARFAVYCFEKDGETTIAENWYNMTLVSGSSDFFTVDVPKSASVIFCRMDGSKPANNWDNKWNQSSDISEFHKGFYEITGKDDGNGEWKYYTLRSNGVLVGEMDLDTADVSQVKCTFTAVAGEVLTVTYATDEEPGDMVVSNYSNNLSFDKHVKIGGEQTLFLKTTGWNAWLSGYTLGNSIPLQNFCDELLSNSISAGTCSLNADSWAALEDRWFERVEGKDKGNWNLTEADRDAFEDAIAKPGNDYTYSSVVQEAKTRYMRMVTDGTIGASDFAGFLSSSRETSPLTDGGNASFALAIIAGISVITVGGLFLLRKRKAE